jgi:nitrate reductase NapAB chaperone NapD
MVSGTTVTGLRRSLERIKLFYRLKCETKVLDSGDIVYVMDAENVTSLQNTIRSLQQVDQAETQTLSNCLSAILQYSRDPTQQQVMINLSQQEAASAAGERAAVGLPAVSGAAAGGEGVVGLPAARDELQESSQIALANIIPPVQILEAIVEPGAATGEDSPPEERAVVEQHLEDVIREQDALKGQAADNAGQGGGRSRKRSASKRTRRKGKQPSKKLKRKSRRYIRRRRSTRRKN